MWTIPNILTVLRLLFALALPMVFALLSRPIADWTAMILFALVAVTDYLDGYIARAWKQTSKLGAMLDPIADKAMVLIALFALVGLYGFNPLIVIPATLIAFREVFVSGLREYLGDKSSTLAVTRLAKWKTATQMFAIFVLLSVGIFEHNLGMLSFGMDHATVDAILEGSIDDPLNLNGWYTGFVWSWYGGLGLFWIAAGLTVITGYDYLVKSWRFLEE